MTPAPVTSTAPDYRPLLCCPRCKAPWLESAPPGSCPRCGAGIRVSDAGVAYDFLALLRAAFPSRYRLYKVLCNNGLISYLELASGSLSLPERKDVGEFGAFLGRFAGAGDRVLDVGCGPLTTPGYLQGLRTAGARLMGLDVNPMGFHGFRITGCAEFLPLPDGSVDVVVFATSLDHVCDLSATLREVRRVLPEGGRCCIWMSDRDGSAVDIRRREPAEKNSALREFVDWLNRGRGRLKRRLRLLKARLRLVVHRRYVEYDNGSVFYCPPGAVDPFHSFFESPAEVTVLAAEHSLELVAQETGSNGVFLALQRESTE